MLTFDEASIAFKGINNTAARNAKVFAYFTIGFTVCSHFGRFVNINSQGPDIFNQTTSVKKVSDGRR